MRRTLAAAALGLAMVGLVVLGLVSTGRVEAQTPLSRGPIRVGLLAPLTGPLAPNGKDLVNGMQLFLEQQKYKIAGRQVQLIIEDDEGKPQTGLTKARSMVEGQGCHVLIGPISAAVGYALAPYLDQKKIPTLFPIVSAEDITQRQRSQYIIRTGWSSGQTSHPFGKWVYDNLKYRRIAIMGYDFAFGWEVAAGFHRTFEEAGGKVVQKIWSPLNTIDYAPYLARLAPDLDAVYAVFSGADALRFTKQYAEAGLKARLPLIGAGPLTDEHVLRSMGDEALGIVSSLHYSAALHTPANQRFVSAYQAKFKQVPSFYSEGAFVSGIALKAGLEATGGDVENVVKLLSAIRKASLADAPRGPIRFDEYGNPVQNIYIRKVERVNGKLQNTVIQTIPKVSQFWTYKPEDYMRQPVYNRDYPPCLNCK